jgi:lipoprotein-releasing system ATP-binding protein
MTISAEGIYKTYTNAQESLPVLKGVSLRVEKGSFISLVGPSGAGKSTLLHVLGGLDSPTKGSVTVDGVDIYGLREDALCRLRNERMGFVFQFYHLLSEFTALENVCMPAMVGRRSPHRSQDDIRKRAAELLGAMGIEKRSGHFPSQLSGGEKQRVAIARALMNDPGILLCDEPTGNLDTGTGANIMALLKKINSEKKVTIIVVTHNQELAETADSVYRMRDGVLAQQ